MSGIGPWLGEIIIVLLLVFVMLRVFGGGIVNVKTADLIEKQNETIADLRTQNEALRRLQSETLEALRASTAATVASNQFLMRYEQVGGFSTPAARIHE